MPGGPRSRRRGKRTGTRSGKATGQPEQETQGQHQPGRRHQREKRAEQPCQQPATPGQQVLGLVVRRDDDLGRPTPVQVFVYTLIFYLTLAATGLLLLVALVTVRHRTLHDLASGLVVVRARALTRGFGSWNMQGGSPNA